jgi:hypothetical protein
VEDRRSHLDTGYTDDTPPDDPTRACYFDDLTELRQKLADIAGWNNLRIEYVIGLGDVIYYQVVADDVLKRPVYLCRDGSFRSPYGELARASGGGIHCE